MKTLNGKEKMKTLKFNSLLIIFLLVSGTFTMLPLSEWISTANAQAGMSPASQVSNDIIQMRDGTMMQGSFVGGDAQTIKFTTAQGVQSIPLNKVMMLTFAPKKVASSTQPIQKPAPTITQAPSQPQQPQTVTIPAGTVLMVRMASQVSSTDASGRRFSGKLVADLSANDVVVTPTGTTVYGRVAKSAQAGRLIGKSELALNLTELNIGGKMYPLMTTNYAEAGKGSFRKTARNVGLGALVGGAFGDSDDAKKGAAIGAGLSVVRKGQSVTVPTGAVLEFRMTQPLTITN